MIRSTLDHLVVAAPDLAGGMAAVADELGVDLVRGGEHARMGTHNALLRVGGASYLEVIACNPAAPSPGRPRWFELDRLTADVRPRLTTWVVRTSDVRTAAAASPVPLGAPERMSRGDLEWMITIPPGGALLEGGVVPMIIEWTSGSHPSGRLPDAGVSLERLDLVHPSPDLIEGVLRWIGFDGPVSAAPGDRPMLAASLKTPRGQRILRS